MGGRYFIAVVILVHLMSKHQIINDKRMDIRYIFSSLLLPFLWNLWRDPVADKHTLAFY